MSFPFRRLPDLFMHYMLSPIAVHPNKAALAAKVHPPHSALSPLLAFLHEHFSPANLWHCMFLAMVGFTGEGSI